MNILDTRYAVIDIDGIGRFTVTVRPYVGGNLYGELHAGGHNIVLYVNPVT
jgi:hypothetical protein